MEKYLCLFWVSILIFSSQALGQIKLPEVPRIDAKMAYYKFNAGGVILVDAMDQRTFAKKHILGSICLPNDGREDIERIRNMDMPFPKNREIIVYCE